MQKNNLAKKEKHLKKTAEESRENPDNSQDDDCRFFAEDEEIFSKDEDIFSKDEEIFSKDEEIDDNSAMGHYRKMVRLANADYGKCYTIGSYQLCPERKIIRKKQMFGTAVIDAIGFFPDAALQYDRETMIIFAGCAFFDKSDFNIDWQTVQLLSYSDHYFEFTDGKTLYKFNHGSIYTYGEKYDKKTYKPKAKEKSKKRNSGGVTELTDSFYVKGKKFYYGHYLQNDDEEEGGYSSTPILETFDVPNLHNIVSKSGVQTCYITDGKQVLYGGWGNSVSYPTIKGKEYVMVKECLLEGVDFATLRVLSEEMLADKNAIYCHAEVIPFNKLEGFKFIIREL